MGKNNKFSLTTKSHSSSRVNPYDKITLNALNVICPDQKIILPKLESNGIQLIIIELYSLFIFIMALGTQYLNLYRSVWWLTQSQQQSQPQTPSTHFNHQQATHQHHIINQQNPNQQIHNHQQQAYNQHQHKSISSMAATHALDVAVDAALNTNTLLSSQTAAANSINYHLIDSDVSQFSIIFIGQSSLICILRTLLHRAALAATSTSLQSASSSATTTTTTTNSTSNSNGTSARHKKLFFPTTPSLTSSKTSTPSLNNLLAQTNISQDSPHNNNNNTNNNNKQQHQTSPLTTYSSFIDGNTLATIVTATASWICNYYLFKCAYRIWSNFGLNGVSCISYPILVSIIMNSAHIIQVVEGCRKTGKLNLSFLTLSMTLLSSHINYNDDKLCHNCSNQPDEIRDEVERLRTIFNERLKFVLFKSILLAYYSSFVPLCFAQSFLYYDYAWTAQHVFITWFSSFIMLISSSYTPHFYDVLYRSAYHFGKWQKLEARNTLVPCINWSENVIYPQGVVVKHYKGYFRSESVSNCAQPGVPSHLRYHIVFSNPKIGFAAALGMLALLLLGQMYLFFISNEWYKLIAMTNMMLINVHSIYRLVKSLVVITKIYKEKH